MHLKTIKCIGPLVGFVNRLKIATFHGINYHKTKVKIIYFEVLFFYPNIKNRTSCNVKIRYLVLDMRLKVHRQKLL